MEMNNIQKNKVGNIVAALVILMGAAYALLTLYSNGSNGFAWFLAIANLIAGPACLIAYINEVRKGVFAEVDEETANEVIQDGKDKFD